VAEIRHSRADFALGASHALRRWQRPAMIGGGAGVVLSILGALIWPIQFFQAWLVSYMFWLGMALGSMGILMLQFITGGRWGAALRRPLEAGASTVPLMALLFVPIAIGMRALYEWADPSIVAHDPILQHKSPYLNPTFFVIRAILYFAVWTVLARKLVAWSTLQDEQGHSDRLGRNFHFLSRGGLMLYALTMTFAAIDWAMSLESHWFSHIYGILVTGGQILTAMTAMIAVSSMLSQERGAAKVLTPERFHDLGKLLLAFIMVWAYFHLSQFLIMWSANLPEEVPWYAARTTGGWKAVTILLVLSHFVLPFIVLLSRQVKRDPRALGMVAAAMVVVRFIDLYWLITPSFSPGDFTLHPLHLTTLVGIGGIWAYAFLGNLVGKPVIAFNDPIIAVELEKA